MTKHLVKQVEFVKSSAKIDQCPKEPINEFAFIGRSNVGKSSLINMLMQRNKLAKISSTPGKTRFINHFIVNNSWHLVDLPGYGFAKRSKNERDLFSGMIKDYVLKREKLLLLFVLVDFRLPPQKIDLEFFDMCGENGVPFQIIFTKHDKVKALEREKNLKKYLDVLGEKWEEIPPYYISSSKSSLGRDEILETIVNLNEEYPAKKF